ncbi:MAG: hypothetical protein A4E20_12350 [Nitrospira sp. SG-bin2]|jgi:hypothetical protein|uniref:hypothetical protein n=1 Tax=Nitrospira cf. moscoviensis SBR1015 TaxID=96242 RepID=UPI000A0E500D|nr:hypothetical protein [Nitrospira cf. moscoviensis SBR1015]OQW33842.1 MAG: hypothetical protein A4E20_12350 [Nitrospira sp. SG-bin2]
MGDVESDRESLGQIEALFSEKWSTPFDDGYDSTIKSLSFTESHLDDADSSDIRRAWTQFLKGIFGVHSSWEWPCNVGMAEWYAEHDKPLHALAVYEHLLREVQKQGLDDSRVEYCDALQEWLLRLFDLCEHQGFTERAIYIAGLIGDFQEEGVIGLVEYAGVLARLPGLRRHELRETIERERVEAERRYREVFGELVANLHDDTKQILIRAEIVGTEIVRKIDPSAAPLCWTLALEAEFYHKVYERNKDRLDVILGSEAPGRRQTCGIGKILLLVDKTISDPLRRPLIEKQIAVWSRLLSVPHIHKMLALITEHRNQIAHVDVAKRGIYTLGHSNEFVRKVRESGWIVEFLSSLQPLS